MVQISIDTERDSPQTIKKIIELLHATIGTSSSSVDSSVQASSGNPFSMFDSSSSNNPSPLPSSAPVSSAPTSVFNIFDDSDRPNNQSSQTSSSDANPFSMFDDTSAPASNTVHSSKPSNSVAGYADNDLFNSFSSDLPSTDFSSPSSPVPDGLSASFQSAQGLLDDDFNPIVDKEPEENSSEEKSANFFSFEQY